MLTPHSRRWKDVLHVLLGSGSTQLANIVAYIALARLFTIPDYGTYRQLFIVNQIAAGVMSSVVPPMLLFFCGRAGTKAQHEAIIRYHFWLTVSLAVLTTGTLWLTARGIGRLLGDGALAGLLPCFSIYVGASMVQGLLPAILLARDQAQRLPYLMGSLAMLGCFATIAAGWLTHDLTIVVVTTTATSAVGAACASVIVLSRSHATEHASLALRDVYSFGMPLLLATAITMIGLRLDQIMVSRLLGTAAFAVYAAGAVELPLYSLVRSSATTALMPEMSAAAGRRDWQGLFHVWSDMQWKNVALFLPISAFLVVFSKEVVTLVFGLRYEGGAAIFAIFALLGPVRATTFALILRAMGKTHADLVGALFFGALVVIGIYPMVELFGMVGAATTMVVATCAVAMLLLLLTARATGGAIPVRRLFPPQFLAFYVILIGLFEIIRVGEVATGLQAVLRVVLTGGVAGALSIVLVRGAWRRVARTLHMVG